ncbi:MAG: VOC family protein, partial [Acidimicrobiales bacterium]
MPPRDSAPAGAPCWIELFTADTDAGCRFYEKLFGWSSESAGEDFGGYINFSKDDVRVAGCMRNDGTGGVPNLWSIYLAAPDAA